MINHTTATVSLATRTESSGQNTADTLGDQRAESADQLSAEAPEPDTDGDTSEEETAGYELPLDQIFELLKNSRRRHTLRYLRENGGETTLSDVAEYIAAIENDTTERAITSSQRKRVYVGLYQCHLPKMDDRDVVDFDKNRGTIKLGENAPQLDPYLDHSETRPWHRLYMAVALAGVALFAVSAAGGASFGLTPTAVLALLLGGIFVCIGAQYRSIFE